jgi:hypothetical protein
MWVKNLREGGQIESHAMAWPYNYLINIVGTCHGMSTKKHLKSINAKKFFKKIRKRENNRFIFTLY